MNYKLKFFTALSFFFLTQQIEAKTVSLLCETAAAAQAATPFGGPFTATDASYSTWSVTIETDENGKILKVNLDGEDKEFDLKGDLVKMKARLLTSLEVNTKTGRARTTITGFDTKEQGACKVVSKSEKGLLD
jgi:hypothetical protein